MNFRVLSVLTLAALLFAGSVCPSFAAQPSRDELSKIYKEGVELYKQKKWLEADEKFVAVLRSIPNEPKCMKYRSEIRRQLRLEASIPALYKELSKLMVDEVNLDEATLEEALDFVSIRSKQLSGGKVVTNFVFRGTDKSFTERKVTLNLSKVPMSAVLDLIGKSTKTNFVFEKHAIVASATADPRKFGVAVADSKKTAPTLRGK